MFSADDVQARVRRKPFAPFQVVTSAGDAYDVRHPDLVMVGKRFLIIGLPSADNPGVFEKETHVAMVHVTELRDVSEHSPTAGK